MQILEVRGHLQVVLGLAFELLRKLFIDSGCPSLGHLVLLYISPKVTAMKEGAQHFALFVQIPLVPHVCRDVVEIIQHHLVVLIVGGQNALNDQPPHDFPV